MGNGGNTPAGVIIAIIAGVAIVLSLVTSILTDIELLGFLF